jgi:hypothetical protein
VTPIREFKFACPVCHQHIECVVEAGGQVIECPTCFQKIIIPQAPTGHTTKLILRAKQAVRPPATPPQTTVAVPDAKAVGMVAAVSGLILATMFSAMVYVLMR